MRDTYQNQDREEEVIYVYGTYKKVSDKKIVEMKEFAENNFITVCFSDGLFKILLLDSFDQICELTIRDRVSSKWKMIEKNKKKVKKKFVEAIELLSKIQQIQYSDL